MNFWSFPGWPEIGHFKFVMGFWGFGRVCIEFTAPLTFILTKFQPEKCHMVHVPTIFHDFYGSGMYPGPSETRIYRTGLSGNTHKVPGPSFFVRRHGTWEPYLPKPSCTPFKFDTVKSSGFTYAK